MKYIGGKIKTVRKTQNERGNHYEKLFEHITYRNST